MAAITYLVWGGYDPSGKYPFLIDGVSRRRAEEFARTRSEADETGSFYLVETDEGRWVSRWRHGKRERKWR